MLKFSLTDAEKFLCLGIRHIDYIETSELHRLYTSMEDNALFELAKINGVACIIAHSLCKVLGKENVPKHWLDEYQKIEVMLTSYMYELDKVANLLAESEIELLALKNSGITRGLYPHYGACPMGDIDVLVSKTKFRKAHKILSDSGYQLKFRSPLEEDNIEAAEHGGGAEYSVTLEDGQHLWFELQWRPVAGRWIQPEQEPKVDDLVKRSVAIENSKVRLLSPEDNLFASCFAYSKALFVRAPGFRLHTDVDRVVSCQNIDWDVFVDRVITLKTKTAVYISLAMSKTLLGTNIPDAALESIKPNTFKLKNNE